MGYRESQERKRRMIQLKHRGGPVWYDEDDDRFKQFSWHDYNRYLKRHTRKQTRGKLNRYGEDLVSQGKSEYKKEYDYWWELI